MQKKSYPNRNTTILTDSTNLKNLKKSLIPWTKNRMQHLQCYISEAKSIGDGPPKAGNLKMTNQKKKNPTIMQQ